MCVCVCVCVCVEGGGEECVCVWNGGGGGKEGGERERKEARVAARTSCLPGSCDLPAPGRTVEWSTRPRRRMKLTERSTLSVFFTGERGIIYVIRSLQTYRSRFVLRFSTFRQAAWSGSAFVQAFSDVVTEISVRTGVQCCRNCGQRSYRRSVTP